MYLLNSKTLGFKMNNKLVTKMSLFLIKNHEQDAGILIAHRRIK